MNLETKSATELGWLVNTRKISPVEVIEYFRDRIAKRNPSLNAMVYTKFDEAIEEARKQEGQLVRGEYLGPLAGVPVGLKDFLPSKKGWTASHGGVKSMITVDNEDSMFWSACKDLGAIAVGKTNAPSFGFSGCCDNLMYGPTHNPWNTEYNSGGSSGGSASAVADGLILVGEGGDAGGSIRIPSAWCGCFGFKPSAGLVPSVCRPDAWAATHPYCCGGPIAKTVLDAAYVIDKMYGYNPRDPLSVPIKINAVKERTQSIKGLRIGVTHNFNLFPDPEDEIVLPFDDVIRSLENIGAIVDDVTFNFKYSRAEIEEAWLTGICIDTAADLRIERSQGLDRFKENPDHFASEFMYWNNKTDKINLGDYRRFHEIRTNILDAHLDVFDKYDIILAPVSGCAPVKNGVNGVTQGPDSINGVPINPTIGFGYTHLENMIGTPAASVPVGLTSEGLPIGLQVIGRRYEDEKVFMIADKLEKAMPWNYSTPFNREIK